MLPEEATRVLAVRARLSAEARREGAVRDRQRGLVEDLVSVKVRQRNLRRRDEEALSAVERLGEAEEVVLELGQLAGALERLAAHEVGHHHLRVAMLSGVRVHKEGDERTLKARERTLQYREARSRQLGRRLHVEASKGARRLVVPLPARRQLALASPRSDLNVLLLVVAFRRAFVEKVGQRVEERLALRLDNLHLRVRLVSDRSCSGNLRFESVGGGGVPLLHQLADLWRESLSLRTRLIPLLDERRALLSERADASNCPELLVGGTAHAQRAQHNFRILSNEPLIKCALNSCCRLHRAC
mmetsp:Transcript_31312/g.72854  ORF Transcript_31312/g.72854 Transcript_31312/m.72854 type:complete len:301 (-) Transcript_31312:157-1059(-)